MTTVERLVGRLQAIGVQIPDRWEFHRTHAGRVQREAGAWSWFITDRDSARDVCGSHWPVADLLAADALTATREMSGDLVIDPGQPGVDRDHPADVTARIASTARPVDPGSGP